MSFDVNVVGFANMVQAVEPFMKKGMHRCQHNHIMLVQFITYGLFQAISHTFHFFFILERLTPL